MASTRSLFVILTVAAVFVHPILATDYIVGDDYGWTTGFDYQEWAKDMEFHVGDKLMFMYEPGAHNVISVDGQSFRQCSIPDGFEPLDSGDDEITLSTPGKKWYICSIGDHCESGNMKLVINVLPEADVPLPSPQSWPRPLIVHRQSGHE